MNPNEFSDTMIGIGLGQIADEGHHVNRVLCAIDTAFFEARRGDILDLASKGDFSLTDLISVPVWQSGDGREWVVLLSKEGELVAIHFYHQVEPKFNFHYDLFDNEDTEEEETQIFRLLPREIVVVNQHLDQLLKGTLTKFPCLCEPMEVYAKAAARAGFR